MHHLYSNILLQPLKSYYFNHADVQVLRLDLLHPIVSGNKWFKLQYYIQEARQQQYQTIGTFGGAFSNHIVACAYVAKEYNFKSIGIIRGEEPKELSPTLQHATTYGMQLHFVSRAEYKHKKELIQNTFTDDIFWINEGGYGLAGALGASEILQTHNTSSFDYIIASCGTGTMLAGLIQAAMPHQHVIGVAALKGYKNLAEDVKKILPIHKQEQPFSIVHDYHFGGYAKYNTTLLNWMKALYTAESLPTDIVYTSKLLFAVKEMLAQKKVSANSKILVIHSGGLQGNLSLPNNTLPF